MNMQEYQARAMEFLGKDGNMVLESCMGLIGECGEIMDVVKKWKFQSPPGTPVPKGRLVEECGDALWYCAELATGLGKNLYDLHRDIASWFDCMTEINEKTSVETMALRLMCIAVEPMQNLFDGPPRDVPLSAPQMAMQEAKAASSLIGIVTQIGDFLRIHCGTYLEEAMELNIKKLSERYPDGFDPEKSLHRGG